MQAAAEVIHMEPAVGGGEGRNEVRRVYHPLSRVTWAGREGEGREVREVVI